MTQEDKYLLLKDLCARLPYGVKVLYEGQVKEIQYIEPLYNELKLLENFSNYTIGIEEIKPYLRPMSSITEEEISDLQKINYQFSFNKFYNVAYVGAADDGFCSVEEMANILNYLNAHHFDYRGLIERSLAIKAPEGMY